MLYTLNPDGMAKRSFVLSNGEELVIHIDRNRHYYVYLSSRSDAISNGTMKKCERIKTLCNRLAFEQEEIISSN
jgi:hypothetical protein